MSNSPLATDILLSPNRTSPRNHVIDTITIHCTAGQGKAIDLLKSSRFTRYHPSKGVSCNYVIGYDGGIGLCVEECDRSWCSSSRTNDHRAITIEVSSEAKEPYAVTDKAYESLIRLLVDICQRNEIDKLRFKNDKRLIGEVYLQNMTLHRWFANKSCPGKYLLDRHPQIVKEVNRRLSYQEFLKNMQQYVKEMANQPSHEYGSEAWNRAVRMGILDGTNPQLPLTREQLAVVLERLGLLS